jgi:hypothetical protein
MASRKTSKRRTSKKGSRKGSKKKLNPALREMGRIVKKLSKTTNLSGPKLMKKAGQIYRSGKKF